MIPEEELLNKGARKEYFDEGERIFQQGHYARSFYQVSSGLIQMTTINDEGKEFIQGIFRPTESFGEPPVFADITYPASATALKKSQLIVFPKQKFLTFLESHPKYYRILLRRLSTRLHYKATVAQLISNEHAEIRILTLIDYLKKEEGYSEKQDYKVKLTRQQIADLIGLRVETVIRTITSLKNDGLLKVKAGKIIR